MHSILLVIHLLVTAFLIGIILIQRSDSDGMGLGGDATKSILSGRSSANVLTHTTAILAGIFMLTSLGLSLVGPKATQSSIVDQISEQPAPATAPAVPGAATPEKAAPEAPAAEKTAPAKTPAKTPAAPAVPKE